MKAVVIYAAASALILVLLTVAVTALVGAASPRAVWLAAGLAWAVQAVAFAGLVVAGSGPGFMVGWGGGMLLRFAVVAAVAVVVTRTAAFDAASVLVSLVGFVFVLVLLEPLFLRLAD